MRPDLIILHHYPQSPVAEKVRVVLGMKGLSWKSVEIPRLPPKPNLVALTGGYRLTPVMQIGADIFCDTKCINRELQRRFPTPTLFPGGAEGMAWGVAEWTDGPLFKDVVTVALVKMAPNMPPEFLADRGFLYFGENFSIAEIKANYQHCLANVRAQFGWMNESLQARKFMLGPEPGLPDALAYYLVWFLRNRMSHDEHFLDQFKNLLKWEQLVKAIGHGTPEPMRDLDALDVAKKATPQTIQLADPCDPNGLSIGDLISIEPASGGVSVSGTLHSISADHVTLFRTDQIAGDVCVHFPQVGYRVLVC
jgi:glutathione S-transferase